MATPHAPHLPTAAALAAAALGFGACAAWLVGEGQRLGGQAGRAEQAVGAASLALALLSSASSARWCLARSPFALRPRLGVGAYLGVLAVAFALGLTGAHLWSGQDRPALGAFAALLSGVALLFGFSLVPWLLVDERGVLDALGRRLPPSTLSRFSLQPVPGEPPRHQLRLWTRDEEAPLALVLVEVDAAALSGRLVQLGVPPASR